MGGESTDALRSFPITLPKFTSPTEKNAQIKPLISDVSTMAAGWELVLPKTMEKHFLWFAGPLDRLRIQAPAEDFPPGGGPK